MRINHTSPIARQQRNLGQYIRVWQKQKAPRRRKTQEDRHEAVSTIIYRRINNKFLYEIRSKYSTDCSSFPWADLTRLILHGHGAELNSRVEVLHVAFWSEALEEMFARKAFPGYVGQWKALGVKWSTYYAQIAQNTTPSMFLMREQHCKTSSFCWKGVYSCIHTGQ